MTLKTVFMFSGQGSQYYGMGRELYERHPGFRALMDRGSRWAEPRLGLSLTTLLYEKQPGRREPFARTLHTHPAIFLLNYCLGKTLQEEGIVPDCLLGYSLGETAAWAVTGALSIEEAMDFVVATARLVEEQSPRAGMMAVLASASMMEERADIFARTTLVGVNHARHFVITGLEADLQQVQSTLKPDGIVCHVLPVQRGFHSAAMEPGRGSLIGLASQLRCRPPSCPVVSCMAARGLAPADLTPGYWWHVLRRPIQFEKTIQALEAQSGPHVYIDAGPSGTLAGFVKNISGKHPASRVLTLLTPFGHDLRQLAQLKAELRH